MATATLKAARIDVRANESVKQLLQEAARTCHKTISEFLLDAGITAANQALADRKRFELDDDQWQAFQTMLDRSVQPPKRHLRELAFSKIPFIISSSLSKEGEYEDIDSRQKGYRA